MKLTAWYNEIDRFCCDWLSNLMDAGHITPGVICDKDIWDVTPDETDGFERCHFFAGIGAWDIALTMAGWRGPIWTGSCPCQPFSAAGKGAGCADDRHLWPAWFWLIRQRGPLVVVGEQVENAIGHGWLDAVFADLEAARYACGAAVLPAAGVGAPHQRHRILFVADADPAGRGEFGRGGILDGERPALGHGADGCGADGRMALATERRRENLAHREDEGQAAGKEHTPDGAGSTGRMGDASGAGAGRHAGSVSRAEATRGRERQESRRGADEPEHADGGVGQSAGGRRKRQRHESAHGESVSANQVLSGFWSGADWLPCRDGKARPVEPGTFPLAHGATARVGRLRAYGNAIVQQVAAQVIAAYMETRHVHHAPATHEQAAAQGR